LHKKHTIKQMKLSQILNNVLIIIIILTPLNIFALDGEIYFGQYFNKTTIRQAPGIDIPPKFTGGIKAGQDIWKFRFYGEVKTFIYDNDGI